MDFHIPHIDGSFLPEEILKRDGSNYVDWCWRLRNVLGIHDLVHVMEGPLDDAPPWDSDIRVLEEYVDALNNTIAVRTLMHATMAPHWQNYYQNYTPYEMVVALIMLFGPQARMQET